MEFDYLCMLELIDYVSVTSYIQLVQYLNVCMEPLLLPLRPEEYRSDGKAFYLDVKNFTD